MGSDAAVTVIAVLGAVAVLIFVPRSISTMRRGDEEWRERWKSLERSRRKAILRTMRRGEPLRDAADSELGSRAVGQLDHVRGAMKPVERIGTLLLVALLIEGLIAGQAIVAIVALSGLALGLLTGGLAWRRRQRLRESVAASRRAART